MHSLTNLNGHGSSEFDLTDNRPATVTFSRIPPMRPLDQTDEFTSTEVTVNPGNEITEIINYSTTLAKYVVEILAPSIPAMTGSTIVFATLPAHMTLSQVGDVYTISGMRSVNDWNIIRTFTWNLPSDYATYSNFSLRVSVEYYDETLDDTQTMDWEVYDPRFYYVAQFESAFSSSVNNRRVRRSEGNVFDSEFIQITDATKYKGIIGHLNSEFTIIATGNLNVYSLVANTSVTALTNATYRPSPTLNAITSITPYVNRITNMIARTYVGNSENLIFSSDTPQIEYGNAVGSTFEVTLTSSLGTFSTSATILATNPYSFSGTMADVNTALAQVRFYPTKDSTASGTFTFDVKKDSVSMFSSSQNLTGSSGSAFVPVNYIFNESVNWQPSNADLLYAGKFDVLLVGGGGGGGGADALYSGTEYPSSAGGAGGVIYQTNLTLSSGSTPYAINIGQGGLGGYPKTTSSTQYSGETGSDTTGFGYTAYGGAGGGINGGASGAPTSFNGRTFNLSYNYGPGGGGSGSAASTTDNGQGGNGLSRGNIFVDFFTFIVAKGGNGKLKTSVANGDNATGYNHSTLGMINLGNGGGGAGDSSMNTMSISSITSASPAVVTTSIAHTFSDGAKIFLYGTSGGPGSLNNKYYWINVISTTKFELYQDSALTIPVNLTPYTVTGGTIGYNPVGIGGSGGDGVVIIKVHA